MYIFRILILIFPSIALSQEVDSLDANKTKALEFFKKAEVYKQGSEIQLALYDSAIYYNPYNADFYFKKSIWYKKTGSFIRSFNILNKAVALDSLGYLGYRAWSKLYFLRDFEGCLRDISDLESLIPNFVHYPWGENMFYLRGLCYMELNNFEKAIDNFNLAYSKDYDYYSLHYKGVCLFKLEVFEKSLKIFQQCLQLNDKMPDTYYYMAACNQKLGNDKEAVQKIESCNHLYNNGYRFTLPFIQPFKTIYQADIDSLKNSI